MPRRIVTARDQVELLSPWREAGRPRRFTQDYERIGGDYFPTDVISRYMVRKEEGFADEKSAYQPGPPLSERIKNEGYEKPVVLCTDGRSGYVEDGHHRVDNARTQGHSHVPVEVWWRTPQEDGSPMTSNLADPWLKGWLTDMRKGRETVGRRKFAERAEDFRWERSFDGPGGWILVLRNPDGNPVTVKTESTRGQRSAANHHGIWYHVSPHELPVGTVLTPGGGKSPWEKMYGQGDFSEHRKHVWVDFDPLIWGGHETPFVYEVSPSAKPRHLPGFDPSDGYATPSATITKLISRDGGNTYLDEDDNHHTAATDKTLEQHLRDTYEPHPPGDPGLPESLVPHLMLPTDIAHHYREYDRPVDDENTAMLTRVIADQGIRQPLKISTDGTHAILHEGNHRLTVARQLGMSHVPVQVTLEKPGEIMTNSADSRPVPLEPVLGEWVNQNRRNLKSFWS